MKLENKKLHKAPEHWSSDQAIIDIMAIIFIVMLIMVIFVCFNSLEDASPAAVSSTYNLIGALVVLLIIIIAYVLLTHLDQRDNWERKLTFNQLLYEMVSEKTMTKLHEKGYSFSRNRRIRMSEVIYLWKARQKMGQSYRIRTGSRIRLNIEFGLTKRSSKHGSYYHFKIIIYGISMDTLELSNDIAKTIQDILDDVEYEKFEQVIKLKGVGK